jgi:PAS domain S-box-containing protein
MQQKKTDRNKDIRVKAEAIFKSEKESSAETAQHDLRAANEELRIHQIELEIQNEELQQARQKLEDSRDEYMFLFHNSPLSYALLDDNAIIRKANNTFTERIAAGSDRIIGLPLTAFMTNQSEQIFNAKYKSLFKKPEKAEATYQFNCRDRVRHFRLNAAQYSQKDGRDSEEEKRILISLIDITDSVEYQQKLEESNRELEKFTYRVSHDLNNQARQLRSFSKLLKGAQPEEVEEFSNYIISLSNEVNSIVEGLLNLSRSSSYEIKRSEISLDVIALDVVRSLRRDNPEREVEVEIEQDLITYADSNLMKILLTNLLSNAWKFTSTQDKAQIKIGRENKENKKTFYVSDNGVGVEPKYLEKVFDTFSRFHSPDQFDGSGIGLATVKKIIDRHGGTIWMESNPGENTTVYFRLD